MSTTDSLNGGKFDTTLPRHCPPDMVIVPFTWYTLSKKQFGVVFRDAIIFSADNKSGALLRYSQASESTEQVDNGAVAILEGCGTKITYVMKFRGHKSFKTQKYSGTGRSPNRIANNREKILSQVTEVMGEFIEKMKHESTAGPLQFGAGGIELEDLYLLELRQVSKASFQPIFAVKKDRATWET
ncbi:hypothetical protein BDY19DRAFT_995899 [Irpex rosettiformis]|uniref:Uncharacterized protein n=1 Tax=Irpex rosettiformis TaxID=378272 RepID=A0ACB8TWB9_9APHY|nr:hypothetical protein BDY19DRAFT_995899 [Irpex rosettiformis]